MIPLFRFSLFAVFSASLGFANYDVIPEPAKTVEGQGVAKSLKLISSKHNPKLKGEGYRLSLLPEGVRVEYGDKAGEFYAAKTLNQIKAQYKGKSVPCGTIEDQPRFGWRGIMIDPARHFFPVDDIKKFIDVMAAYKFNKLHLHLTDDQGWRFPVKGYPKLETISSKRAETDGNKTPHEGMYTREDLKEIVRYAAQRHIEVIPEVDAPGHNQALAAAYPELICFPNKDLKVRTIPGVSKELVCPANEKVWDFYQAVMKELSSIFPSRFVHLGGDEAPEDNWMACKACASWRKQADIQDPAPLSPSASEQEKKTHQDEMKKAAQKEMLAFFDKLSGIVRKEGKEPLFWYEAPIANYPKGSHVYTWRMGLTPSTIEKTRNEGLNLICSAGEHCYLDYAQNHGDTPQGTPVTTLKQSYNLDPGYGLSEAEQKHIVGVEATMWAEFIPNLDRLFYMAYPRALALSEAGWSPMSVRSWDRFSKKLEFHNRFMNSRWKISLDRPQPNAK